MIKLISSQPNIRYFSGFTGSIGIFIIIPGKPSILIVDGRYTEQARSEVLRSTKVLQTPVGTDLWDMALGIIKKNKIRSIGYEEDKIDVTTFNKIRSQISGLELSSISKEIRNKKAIKNAHEVDIIAKAALIADLTYDCIVHIVRSGMTEREISAHIDYLIKTFKGENPAFETLVSSGRFAAFPHGKPTDKIVGRGELILMDFGARYKGYNSDITRMVSLGKPSKKQEKIYSAVINAQEAAISKIKDGIEAGSVDRAAREVFRKEDLEKYFVHGTGHGIGLQVHEAPRITDKSKDVLKEGMVFTVEPGIYIPDLGGFRVEDMVLVKKNGSESLTKSSKELKVIS